MRFSPVLKSSTHCLPSPNGKLVASLLSSSIHVTAVESLETSQVVKLPTEFAAGVTAVVWSSSSERLLLAAADEIRVFSVTHADFQATIRNPSSSVGKSGFIDFGATDREVFVFSAHGIKLSVFNLATAKIVEITSPKFYTTVSGPRGFSLRPHTNHLALLTRIAGKDTISIHSPESREAQRSWSPDVIDVQGLTWTPDGRWLVVWESAAQGHRVVFFTSDGHKYRDWHGPTRHASEDVDYQLAAGIKAVVFSPDSRYAAIGDHGRCICVLHTTNTTEQWILSHPRTIEPKDTIQVWQEQIDSSKSSVAVPEFVRASHTVCPLGRAASSASELKIGVQSLAFDCASALLAVVLEDNPSTLWIWDVHASELRAVLMFHSEVTKLDWHPTQAELLFVRCEWTSYTGNVFVWDPLSAGPRCVDFQSHHPDGKTNGKASISWLKSTAESASLFYADRKACILNSLAESDEEVLPWHSSQPNSSILLGPAAESPLNLIPLSAGDMSELDDSASRLDDTFHFKKLGPE
ncbi:WD40 domain-containing protein [Xylariales sp. PMI_506]|nr:WD40 domain-containing protein [Xylariales sp. PMI_506]